MDDTRRRLIRGLMHPPSGPEVGAKQYDPSPAISDCVANLWTTRWSLPPGAHHTAVVLTEPTINLGLEVGACRITGVQRRIFTRVLEGDGSIVAAKFKPGGAAMFLGALRRPSPTPPGRRRRSWGRRPRESSTGSWILRMTKLGFSAWMPIWLKP